MAANNALPALGTLNRALTHLTFASYPALNISISNMGKSFARVNFEGDFAQLAEVAVGAVPSPEPYVIGNVSVGVLRTQALGASWLAQIQDTSSIGTMTAFPDTAAFPAITLNTTIVKSFDPDAYDGTDPVIKMVLRGIFYPNSSMWTQ